MILLYGYKWNGKRRKTIWVLPSLALFVLLGKAKFGLRCTYSRWTPTFQTVRKTLTLIIIIIIINCVYDIFFSDVVSYNINRYYVIKYIIFLFFALSVTIKRVNVFFFFKYFLIRQRKMSRTSPCRHYSKKKTSCRVRFEFPRNKQRY